MKMHSAKYRDPFIALPHPVTLIVPIVEETLRVSGVAPVREDILDRFMSAHPRVAVVHSSDDHPPAAGSRDCVRRMVRQVWAKGGIPFDVAIAAPCEDLAQGHDGMHYALVSRNFCAATLAAQMESHGYDAAVVIGVCDKMVVGFVRALIEADQARQRRKSRPVFAAFVPSSVNREAFFSEHEKLRFNSLRTRLTDEERQRMDDLLARPVSPQGYGQLRNFVEQCFDRRLVQDTERNELERVLARNASSPSGNCAASEASVIHRLVVAALGIVPKHLDLSTKPPSDEDLGRIADRLVQASQKRERRIGVWNLVRTNLTNAAAVWAATGAHPAWLLHLGFLADALSKRLSIDDLMRISGNVPQILDLDQRSGHSAYALASESESGGNTGIDTIMRTLSERRMIEERSPTLDGPWSHRISDARSANGNFLHSTMTPVAPAHRLTSLHGNFCSAAIARVGGPHPNGLDRFDRKLYLAVSYLGQKELSADAASPGGVLGRLRAKVSREDLVDTWRINWANGSSPEGIAEWHKNRLWEFLVEKNLVRVMVVVAGEGPHASGMPELACAGIEHIGVLLTDGRVSYSHSGLSIGNVVPEAFDGGALAAIRTGDWIFLDLKKGVIEVVAHSRGSRFHALQRKDLSSRADLRRHVAELHRRREEILPSVRALLDQVSAADTGVSPHVH